MRVCSFSVVWIRLSLRKISWRPRLAHLDDPFELGGLKSAVARIEQAIDEGEDVVVFGDYDVDGITSTVQLVTMLRHLSECHRGFVCRSA